jgi:HAD superfamily phosphatase
MTAKVHLHAVLFDMDGVLVDVSGSYRRAIEETVEHFTGREILPDVIQRYKNAGGFNDDWKLTHAIISDTGMSVPFGRVVDEFQRRYRGEAWDGFITQETALVSSDTLDAIAAAGRVMGIVTGRPHAEAVWTIEKFGWKKYFPLVVARERQDGRSKPDPYPLRQARAMLDAAGHPVSEVNCAYIGDTVDDMVAARAAGMWAVGIVPPYTPAPEDLARILTERGAHIVLREASRLPDVVERLQYYLATPDDEVDAT